MAGNTDTFAYKNCLINIIKQFEYISGRYTDEALKRKVDMIQQVLACSAGGGYVDLTKSVQKKWWEVPFFVVLDRLHMPEYRNGGFTGTTFALQSFDGQRFQILYIDVRVSTTDIRNFYLAKTIYDELKAKNLHRYLLAFVADANPVNLKISEVSPSIPLLWDCNHLRASLVKTYHSDVVHVNVLFTKLYNSLFLRNGTSPDIERWIRFVSESFNTTAADIIRREIGKLENVSDRFFALLEAPTFKANFANKNCLEDMGKRWFDVIKKAIQCGVIPIEYVKNEKGQEFLSYLLGAMAIFDCRVHSSSS